MISGSSIIPSARYRDAYAAIEWLCAVFGFEKRAVYGDRTRVDHAELTRGQGLFMLGSLPEGASVSNEGFSAGVIAEDCEAIYARAKEAGAEIVQELHEPPYGGKAFTCRDLEGHTWWVGSYDPWAVPPSEVQP